MLKKQRPSLWALLFLVMMPKMVGVVLDQMTRIV